MDSMNPKGTYVNTSIKRLRKRLGQNVSGAEVLKSGVQEAVQTGVDDFVFRLNSGQVKIETVADFERLVKLGLLVHGEATDKLEVTTDIEAVQQEEIRDIVESEEFESIREKLLAQMNKQNEGKH